MKTSPECGAPFNKTRTLLIPRFYWYRRLSYKDQGNYIYMDSYIKPVEWIAKHLKLSSMSFRFYDTTSRIQLLPGIKMNIALAPLELTTLNIQDSIAVCKFSDVSFDELSEGEEEEPQKVYCRYCRRSRTCCIVIYLGIALICASSLASIVVVGLVICIPYHNARHFMEASCRTVQLTYISSDYKCSCGKRCNSSYPCLVLEVEYMPHVSPGAVDTAMVHEDETKLNRKVCLYDVNSVLFK